jgi:hypothetical protein
MSDTRENRRCFSLHSLLLSLICVETLVAYTSGRKRQSKGAVGARVNIGRKENQLPYYAARDPVTFREPRSSCLAVIRSVKPSWGELRKLLLGLTGVMESEVSLGWARDNGPQGRIASCICT